jgi:N-acetylneuraminate lyase
MTERILGLVAAAHTPMHPDGTLNLSAVEQQAAHYCATGVVATFIGGSTGEGLSLTHHERRQLTERWMDVARSTPLKVLVHVGGNCLKDATELASQAQQLGADGVATLPPFYFKPQTVASLVDVCATIAASAPALPFYLYTIPALTGVRLSMVEFLERGAEKIPNLAGLKYTDSDLMQMQECLQWQSGRFDILHGYDESLLAGLSLGAGGAVGSTYNFAAGLYREIIAQFHRGDLDKARLLQHRSVCLIRALQRHDFAPSAKSVMQMIGVDCGPVRPPLRPLTPSALSSLRGDLESGGFFDDCLRSSSSG